MPQSFAEALAQVRSGLLTSGNIDLAKQPSVPNPDGTRSTVDSRSYGIDGHEVLLPSVTPDGHHLQTDDEIVAEYRKTGRHLGIFDTPAHATAYAQQLHEDYAAGKYDRTVGSFAAALQTVRQGRPPVRSAELVAQSPARVSTPAEVPIPPRPPLATAAPLKVSTTTETVPTADEQATMAWIHDLVTSMIPERPPDRTRSAQLMGRQPTPPAPRPDIDPKTGQRVTNVPLGKIPVIDAPVTGVPQMVRGAAALGRLQEQAETTGQLSGDEAAAAGSEFLEGVFRTAEPLIAAGFLANPVGTAWGLFRAAVASEVGAKGAEVLGATPEGQRLVGNIAALAAGSKSAVDFVTDNLVDAAKLVSGIAKAKAQVLTLTTKLSGTGYGTGDVPGYRATPYTDTATARPTEQPLTPSAQALEEDIRQAGRPGETAAKARTEGPQAPAPTGIEGATQTPQARLEALPTVGVGNSRQTPFPVHEGPDAARVLQAAGEEATERDVAIADLVTTQTSFDPSIVATLLKAERPVGTVPTGVAWQGKVYLETGLHQAVAAWAKGEETLTVAVRTADPAQVGQLDAPRAPTHQEPATPTSFADALDQVRAEAPTTFSSTQVQLPPRTAKKMTALAASIPDADLAEKGREDEFHVTIKWGIHTQDVAEVRRVLANEPPITVRFGKTSVFPDSGNGEVLKVDVDSPDLHRLNAKIAAALETTDTHPTYQPHATLAFLKPGKADAYIGRTELDGDATTIDQVVFSTPDGQQVIIPLTGAGKVPAESRPTTFKEALDQVRSEGETGVESGRGARTDTGELPAGDDGAAGAAGVGSEGPLETLPSTSGEGSRGERPARTRHGDSGGVLADGVSGDAGAATGAEPAAADGGSDVPAPVAVSPAGATHDPSRGSLDFDLTPARIQAIIGRGNVTRAKDNLAAIRLVKQLQAEDRYPTVEEQEALAKYVGWGAADLANLLGPTPRGDWSKNERAMWEELQALPKAERDALLRSTPNAHFTYDLYVPIWEALVGAGFSGGRVLEPAVGTGHAFGFMPADVRAASTLNASELEPLTAAIAGYLYPSATVQPVGYQSARIASGTQDLVLSNVPFGDYGVTDTRLPDFLTERIHNYFFAKALEHVRPGGLIAFVTSRYTLDSIQFTKVRRYLMEHADFLGAVRLPNTAFDKSAKTEVITDIVLLRKRGEDAPDDAQTALNRQFTTAEEHPDLPTQRSWNGKPIGQAIYRSSFYTAHPDLVLGTESREGTMRIGGEYTVTAATKDLPAAIAKALGTVLPPGTYTPVTRPVRTPAVTQVEGPYKPGELRVGAAKHTIERVTGDGTVVDATPRRRDGQPDLKAIARITGQISVRDALRATVQAMLDPDATDAAIAKTQKALTQAYERFVRAYGDLNNPTNKRLFKADPEAANLLGLEKLDAKATVTTRKDGKDVLQIAYHVVGRADIFTKRTLKPQVDLDHADTPKDGLLASLGRTATIDWAYISRITGTPVKDAQAALAAQGLVFEQPDGSFALAEEYLAGDVVTKLRDAEAAAAGKKGDRFTANVEALQAIQPVAKTRDDIQSGAVGITLGAHWIDPEDIGKFADEALGQGRRSVRLTLEGTSTMVQWTMRHTDEAVTASGRHALAVRYAGNAKVYDWLDLLNDTLNLKMPSLGHYEGSGDTRVYVKEPDATLAARANQEVLRAEWLQYVYRNEGLQDRTLAVYNERFNRTVERQFDGSHLTYPGKSDVVTFYPHQDRAVWRILTTGNTLLAHEVGAGKTFEMIAAAMEMRRTGRARKPMITVPTYLLSAWRNDVMRLYPNARLLAFDEKDLEKDRRQQSMARIAFGEWDLVLVPHSSFGLLRVGEERVIEMMQRWVQEILDAEAEAGGDADRIKDLVKQRLRIEKKIAAKMAALDKSADRGLTWEQLGVDALMVDEAQAFKNLFFFTKLENLRGLSKSESDRALDLYVKVQDLNDQSHYRNLVLATATPVMNSLAEAYTMQRYLQPQTLRRYGVDTFDNWYAMFAKALPTTESQPDGTYKEVMRLRDFHNLQLLSRMVREVMDYMGWEDMPYLKLPKIAGGKIEIVQTDPHPMYPVVKEWFAQRMQRLRDNPPHVNRFTGAYVAPDRLDPITGASMGKPDNILTVMTDAKKSAVDIRLVLGDRASDVPGSRIQVAAAKMVAFWKRETAKRGVQLVFLDMGTPKTPPPLEFLRDVAVEDVRGEADPDTEDVVDDEVDAPAVVEDDSVFNLYDALKAELVKRGVPSREIAYIHSATNSAQRLALFAAANEGKIRFVFASTDKGGVGMNIQTRLFASHEIDPPRAQRPGDLRQRMGRSIRQGNTYPEVHLVRYVTKGTTDEWLWGLLNTKDYQIRQFLKGHASTMTEDDPSTMSLQEAQVRASGDARVIELTELKGKLARLEAQASAAERAMQQAKSDVSRGTQKGKAIEQDLTDLRAWVAASYTPLRGDKFTITIKGKTYTERPAANEALIAAARPIIAARTPTDTAIGTLGGLAVRVRTFEWGSFDKSGARHEEVSARLTLDGTPYGGSSRDAGRLETLAGDATTLGAGSNPTTTLVNAYEGIPKLEDTYEAELKAARDQVTAGARVLEHPPTVIVEHKRAIVRVQELEAELRAEGAANEAARSTRGRPPARTADEIAQSLMDRADDYQDGTLTEAEWKQGNETDWAEADRLKLTDQVKQRVARPGTAGMPQVAGDLPVRPKPAVETIPLPVDAIVQKLSLLFDKVPVAVGHFKQRFRAIYKVDPQAVRSRQANDLYAIAHEFGHHLDLALMKGSSTFVRGPIAQELKTLGAVTSKPSYSAAQRRQEGAAEFFRIWLLEPERLPLEAPQYLREFVRYLGAHPEIDAGLIEIRDDIQTYLSLPPEEQTKLHIDFTGGSASVMARAGRLATLATDAAGRRDALTYLSSQWVDDLAWLRRVDADLAAGRPIDITQSAYALARLARGATEKAEGMLRYGVRDADGQFTGTSFDQALAPVADQLVAFAQYITAIHAREMTAEGVESGLTLAQITATIDRFQSPAFDAAVDRLNEFHRAKRAYLVETEVLSRAAARAMQKRWANYVPMQRVRETVTQALGGGKKIANRTSPIKRLKGSTRRVINPLESIIRNTHHEVATAEANKAMLALVRRIAATPGSAKWLEEIPAPNVPTRFNLSAVEDAIREDLEKSGIDLPNDFVFDDLATVWTPRQFARGNEQFVTVIDQGTVRWYEVHEPGLYDAITSIGPQNTEALVSMFWKGAQTLRTYATATLGFVLRNPTRDIPSAMVQSRAGFTPLDFLRGLFSYLKHDESFQLFLHSGAGQATLVSADRDLLRRRLGDLGKSKLRQFLNHTVLGPISGLQAVSHALETATRLGEFKKTLAKIGVSEAGLLQGGLNARDVTQDFSVMGRQVRAWNRYVAFFGARVGGYARLYQAWREGGGSGPSGAGGGFGDRSDAPGPIRFLWKALSTATLLSILLWALHRDDDEYYGLPAWERNAYWHVPLGGARGYIRIMKPFEIGQLFGTSAEVALDWLAATDPAVGDRLPDKTTAMQMILMIIPTAILPWVEVAANYDFFRDRAIVNPYDVDLEPELQYNRWTSETAKKLGAWLHFSPAKIETLIYGYTAGVGRGVLAAGDVVLGGDRPSGGIDQWPGIGDFYRAQATSDAQELTDFYEARDTLNGVQQSIKRWRAAGQTARIRQEQDAHHDLIVRTGAIRGTEAQLKNQRATLERIWANPGLTPAQKQQQLADTYRRMRQAARRALGRPAL